MSPKGQELNVDVLRSKSGCIREGCFDAASLAHVSSKTISVLVDCAQNGFPEKLVSSLTPSEQLEVGVTAHSLEMEELCLWMAQKLALSINECWTHDELNNFFVSLLPT